jgi:enoyl-CoA hydratase
MQDAGVARLRFVTEPAGKPATIDQTLLDALDRFCGELEQQPAHSVVVEADSPKYFVVGANIEALQQLNEQTIDAWVRRGHAVLHRLASLPMPVIAKVRGFCLGGGLEVALACDVLVASSDAHFGLPEASLGLVPGWAGTSRLPQKVGPWFAKRMVLTGQRIDAAEAARVGLVDLLVEDPAALDARVDEMCQSIAGLSAPAVTLSKRLCDANLPADAWKQSAEHEAVASVQAMREGDTQSRLAAFFASRRK